MRRTLVRFDWQLSPRVARVRKRMSRAEAILWNELKGRKLLGCKFERHCPIDRYVVDFYCERLAVAIEVDAMMQDDPHALRYDHERNVRLRLCGVVVLCFNDDEVIYNLDGVLAKIRQSIRYLPAR
ncbi:MAG: DUF559 domain-containing protein [Burkholderiales bacterium]|nr:DUF559 domain-containing protein [Burkholderiales bacterium]